MTNTKALKFIKNQSNLNALLSYLEADKSKSFQNSITTIPMNQRNSFNGYSNLFLTYKEKLTGLVEQLNIRLETNVFLNKICLKPNLIKDIANANLIVFTDTTDNRLFISDAKLNNNHFWLQNKSLRNIESYKSPSGKAKSCYSFNIETLLETHAIFEVIIETGNIYIIHDSFYKYFNQQVMKIKSDKKYLVNYNIETDHITDIQFDKKERDTVYYCFNNENQTDKAATLLGLAEIFADYTDQKVHTLYMKLRRAAKDEKFITIKCNKEMDKRFINENGDIEIALSFFEDTFINKVSKEEKEEKQKDYNKMYTKVKKYKKTHDCPKESWTNEEKELFYKL